MIAHSKRGACLLQLVGLNVAHCQFLYLKRIIHVSAKANRNVRPALGVSDVGHG